MVGKVETADTHDEFVGTGFTPCLDGSDVRQIGDVDSRRDGEACAISTIGLERLDHRWHATAETFGAAHRVPTMTVGSSAAPSRCS